MRPQVRHSRPLFYGELKIKTFKLGEPVSIISYELQKGAQMSIAIQ